jgi:hypothetical protein
MKLDKSHAWSVQVTLPADQGKGRRWAHNDTITVITQGGAEAAMTEVKREYPDATIWAVHHLGSRTVLLLDVGPSVKESDGRD